MAAVYRFERTLEHRIQLFQMRRTHLVPEGENDLRRIGRSMGFRTDPANELEKALKRIRQDARRLHEKLFYRPLLQAVARLDPNEARLSLDAAQERLSALGFVDSESALRHLAALSQGVSRRAAIQRTLLPVMLQWMAETPTPDAGLLAFRKLSDELGATPWYLRLLRDESAVAEHMAHLLSISRYFAALLMRTPEAVGMLADLDDLHPKTLAALSSEMLAVAARQVDAESGVMAIRSIRQRELIRISAAQLIGVSDLRQTGNALSDLMDATVQSALEVVRSAHFANKPPSLEISAIALGRWGGRELNFGSDADAMFVYRQLTESAGSDALAIVSKLQQLLSQPAVDPPLELDLDLRPEGKNGPIARSIDSYKTYYERWSLTWESQALLRARAVGGSQVGFELIEFIDSLRYPAAGLSESDKREIRRIKARVEAERLPRGADPALHVKLGPGGISDVEWAVQFLQLQIAHLHPELQSTSTVESLNRLEEVGIIDSASKSALLEVWTLAGEIRNANTLALAKSSDSIPTNPQELRQIAYLLKFQNGAELVEKYRKLSRRARKIMQEIVYGDSQN
jgi:glutamate-ammonia-ligase adenylyltransferase